MKQKLTTETQQAKPEILFVLDRILAGFLANYQSRFCLWMQTGWWQSSRRLDVGRHSKNSKIALRSILHSQLFGSRLPYRCCTTLSWWPTPTSNARDSKEHSHKNRQAEITFSFGSIVHVPNAHRSSVVFFFGVRGKCPPVSCLHKRQILNFQKQNADVSLNNSKVENLRLWTTFCCSTTAQVAWRNAAVVYEKTYFEKRHLETMEQRPFDRDQKQHSKTKQELTQELTPGVKMTELW